MTILDTADYAALRLLLHSDDTALPDATLLAFIGLTDPVIKRYVPGWESLSGDALLWLDSAALYLTAERIALSQPGGESVSGLGFSIKENAPTAAQLRDLAALELAALGVELPTATGFAVQVARADGYTELAEWG